MDSFDIMMVALKFNVKINKRGLDGLTEFMTPDHTFIDSEGEVYEGREAMKEGWRDFFSSYPNYRNIFTRVQVEDDFVAMVGYSTCSHGPLDGPALWSARVREGLVSEWRVYEDTPQNRRKQGIMA